MCKVAVLLSAYRGKKYIIEQLDSIRSQESVSVQVFIRDDGSQDDSIPILRDYAARYSNIHLLERENVGVGNSFMNLLYEIPGEFDYYAFSDQDDIWDSYKLAEAVRFLKEKGALLYGSNQECVDKNGKSLGLRYLENEKIHLTPISVIQENSIAGCTMVFSRTFWEILSNPASRPNPELLRNRIHDVWVASVAAIHGGLVYDNRSFMKYRQHENNVVGAYTGGFRDNIKTKWKKIKRPELRKGRSCLAKELLRCFPEKAASVPLLPFFAEADTLRGKVRLLFHAKDISKEGGELQAAVMAKIILGFF